MKIPCKKCLLAEMGMSAEYEDVQTFISVLPEDQKVYDEVYKEQLEICKRCDSLEEGTCLECGCYVEMRAIKKRLTCPSGLWKIEDR
ncbi:MAG: DUF6171 family protein [Oscillospiraceae bacterium]|nr:DUF6171 family protein [Oscillospiraceae bacterium]